LKVLVLGIAGWCNLKSSTKTKTFDQKMFQNYKFMVAQTSKTFVTVAAVVFVAVVAFAIYKSREHFTRYTGVPYPNMCEFNRDCLWDTARWVQLSNGMEGVCTLHGIACPAFSKNHVEASTVGLSPDMVSERWANRLRQQHPFIADQPHTMLSSVWGVNPPLINHFQDGRFRWSDVYPGSGVVSEVKTLIPNNPKDFFAGDTAVSLGMYPTSGG